MKSWVRKMGRSATRLALVGAIGVGASVAGAEDGGVFFEPAVGARAGDTQLIAVSDAELDRLRGRLLPSPAEPDARRKRVILWDEARAPSADGTIEGAGNAVVIRPNVAGAASALRLSH